MPTPMPPPEEGGDRPNAHADASEKEIASQPGAQSSTENTVASSATPVERCAGQEREQTITKGTIVSVQPRTWPGINKPGGVARVTKVHPAANDGDSTKYDVAYILGGKEKQVDGIFVTLHNVYENPARASVSAPKKSQSDRPNADASEEEIASQLGAQSSTENTAASLDASGDVEMNGAARKSSRARTPSVRYIEKVDDPPRPAKPPSSSPAKRGSGLPATTYRASPTAPELNPPPETPGELYDQIKRSRDRLFFIAYSHSKDPAITDKAAVRSGEHQWYLVRVDLTTCRQLEDTQDCAATGRYYVEFYTKCSYDCGVLLPGHPMENGVPSSKMRPRPDSDSRYWLEWHEYHFDKKNGDMVVGKAKEFLPNSKKAIQRRLMDLCQRTRERRRRIAEGEGGGEDGGEESEGSAGSEGEERLMSEYLPDFDKYTAWADVVDLMDAQTRLVGPFDFDDVKPPPLREEDLALFNEETRRLFAEHHADLYVRDRVHPRRWQELLDAIGKVKRNIAPPTMPKPEGRKRKTKNKKKKDRISGSKRPREEPTRKPEEGRRPEGGGPVCQDCGNGAAEGEQLLFFPAVASRASLTVRASCRKENNDRMVASKERIREGIMNVVDAAFARTRHATAEGGEELYVLGEVKEALNSALGKWMEEGGMGQPQVPAPPPAPPEQGATATVVIEGLPEEDFVDKDVESRDLDDFMQDLA